MYFSLTKEVLVNRGPRVVATSTETYSVQPDGQVVVLCFEGAGSIHGAADTRCMHMGANVQKQCIRCQSGTLSREQAPSLHARDLEVSG